MSVYLSVLINDQETIVEGTLQDLKAMHTYALDTMTEAKEGHLVASWTIQAIGPNGPTDVHLLAEGDTRGQSLSERFHKITRS